MYWRAQPPKPKSPVDFLTLWKDADPDPDPDIPILKEAKAEYSKLKLLGSENCGKVVARNLTSLPKLTSLTIVG